MAMTTAPSGYILNLKVTAMKQAKIKGGIYRGKYWTDFYTSQEAKKIAHKQARPAWKHELIKEK